jgi:hypothetical protein
VTEETEETYSTLLPGELGDEFGACTVAIRDQRYADAMEQLDRTIVACMDSELPIDAKNLAKVVYSVVVCLETTLYQAFGDKWPAQIPLFVEKPVAELGTTCSFCLNSDIDPDRLVHGPAAVSVCASCARAHYEALS